MKTFFIVAAVGVAIAVVFWVGWRLANMATEFDKIFGEGGEQ